MIKVWAEYHHSAFTAELCALWRGTEDQLVEKFRKEFGEEDLTYEELMDCGFQQEMDFTLEEFDPPQIQDLDPSQEELDLIRRTD